MVITLTNFEIWKRRLRSWSRKENSEKDYQTYHQMEEKSTDDHKENDQDNPKQVVGEIRTITGGPVVGGHTSPWEKQSKGKSIVFK